MIQSRTISRDTQAGVTLVEILVVLALLGVLTGAVAFSLGGVGRANSVAQEADLLVARLNRAADEVILTATPLRFDWTVEGYQFRVRQGGDNWVDHPIGILAQTHVLPTGLVLKSDNADGNVTVDIDLVPTPRDVLTLQLSSGIGAALQINFDGVNAVVIEDAL